MNTCIRVVFIQMKNGLSGLDLALHEVDRGLRRFVVDGLHPLAVQRAGILGLAVGKRVEDAAGRVVLDERLIIFG